jgi:hypothetical protein
VQWLEDPNKSIVNILNTVRLKASRLVRNRKREYLKAKIKELETNNNNKNTRDV